MESVDALFKPLLDNNFYTKSSYSKCTQIVTLFIQLQALPNQLDKKVHDKVQLYWQTLHKTLCKTEEYADLFSTFLPKQLSFEEASIKYSVFLIEAIFKYNFNEDKLFSSISDKYHKQLVKTLKENCAVLPNDICFKYLHMRVLPSIFCSSTTNEERRELCELVFALPLGFANKFMSKIQQQAYKAEVMKNYIPFLLSNKLHPEWRPMCKVLIHYSGKLLHTDSSLTNAILKVVEQAFKITTVDDRCSAYECWKILINNYALDQRYLENPKQVALLLKPLKAKISRNRIVAIKKYDTYVHLMERLDFATEHLEKFLVFAFGPFDEEYTNFVSGDSVLNFRDIITTCPKSCEILLKILGHKPCLCERLPLTNIFNIDREKIDRIKYKFDVLVHSVRLSSQISCNWLEGTNREIIITCLWSSLFTLLQHKKYADSFVANLKSILCSIAKILNCSHMNENYYNILLKIVFQCLLRYLSDVGYKTTISNELVINVIKEIITFHRNFPDKLPASVYNDCGKELLQYCKVDLKTANDFNVDWTKYKTQFASDIIMFVLQNNIKETAPHIELDDEALKIILTNVINIHTNKDLLIRGFEKELVALVSEKSTLVIGICDELMKKSDTNIIGIHKIFSEVIQYTVDQRYSDESGLNNFILGLMIKFLYEWNGYERLENLKIFANALEYMVEAKLDNKNLSLDSKKVVKIFMTLINDKVYDVVQLFIKYLDCVSSKDLTADVYQFATDLLDKEDIPQSAFALYAKLYKNGISNTTISPSNKVEILANTVVTPKSTGNTSIITLFGKECAAPSPQREKPTAHEHEYITSLESSPKSRFALKRSNIPVDEISESAFTAINSEINYNTEKMTEHQKDIASKTCSDCPALYSDLTQSRDETLNEKEQISPNTTNNEMRRLKMDIVGVDEFVNLPRSRRKFRSQYVDISRPMKKVSKETIKNKSPTTETNHTLPENESVNVISPSQKPELKVTLYKLPGLSPTSKDHVVHTKQSTDVTPPRRASINVKLNFNNDNDNDQNLEITVKGVDEEKESSSELNEGNKMEFTVDKSLCNSTKNDTFTLEISKSNTNIADLETETFIESSSIEVDKQVLTSPITCNTPSRTKELLDSTLNISPIKAPDQMSEDIFASQNKETVEPVSPPQDEGALLKSPSSRSNKLLNYIPNLLTNSITRNSNFKPSALSSPKTERIRKMMLNCVEENKQDDSSESQPGKGPCKNVLEFNRPVPSPLAVPGSSILKRKLPDTLDEGMSPCPKRKRVNFSDPPTTCEKVYFKQALEYEKRKLRDRKMTDNINTEGNDTNDDDKLLNVRDLNSIEGIEPLKDANDEDANDSDLRHVPENAAPELLSSLNRMSMNNLFPLITDQNSVEGQRYEGQRQVFKAIFQMAANSLTEEDYLSACLSIIPDDKIENWLAKKKM